MPENIQKQLENCRRDMDIIDTELCALITRRIECSRAIGQIKKTDALTQTYQPERECEILDRLEKACVQIPAAYIRRVWTELFSLSRAEQQFLPVAVPCRTGDALHLAARLALGRSIRCTPCGDMKTMCLKLQTGECGLGLIPAGDTLPEGCRAVAEFDVTGELTHEMPEKESPCRVMVVALNLPGSR